jgi:hypothetical protein
MQYHVLGSTGFLDEMKSKAAAFFTVHNMIDRSVGPLSNQWN